MPNVKPVENVLESDIERSFARRCPFPCPKFHGLGERGKVDRIVFALGGRPWLIEFKKPGEVPTRLQAQWQGRMKKLGYQVTTIDSKELAEEYLALFKYYAKTKKVGQSPLTLKVEKKGQRCAPGCSVCKAQRELKRAKA
jgi:hypothetical protein